MAYAVRNRRGGPLKIRLGGFGASNGACRHNPRAAMSVRSPTWAALLRF